MTRGDYANVLIPKVKEALGRRERLRCYYELGPDFAAIEPGAMWEDLKLGIENLFRWERVAIVTDVDWIRHAIGIFRFLVPGDVRIFASDQAADARRWITA